MANGKYQAEINQGNLFDSAHFMPETFKYQSSYQNHNKRIFMFFFFFVKQQPAVFRLQLRVKSGDKTLPEFYNKTLYYFTSVKVVLFMLMLPCEPCQPGHSNHKV